MTRAEAIAELIRRVEAGEFYDADIVTAAVGSFWFSTFCAAEAGSLDVVASLEAPLRARGWTSVVERNGDGQCFAELVPPRGRKVFGRATTEARARLLAVLRALHSEATQ